MSLTNKNKSFPSGNFPAPFKSIGEKRVFINPWHYTKCQTTETKDT